MRGLRRSIERSVRGCRTVPAKMKLFSPARGRSLVPKASIIMDVQKSGGAAGPSRMGAVSGRRAEGAGRLHDERCRDRSAAAVYSTLLRPRTILRYDCTKFGGRSTILAALL